MPARFRPRLDRLDDRLTPAWGLDPAFADAGRLLLPQEPTNGRDAEAVAALPDGRAYVVGTTGGVPASQLRYQSFPEPGQSVAVERRLADGSADPAFGRPVIAFDPVAGFPYTAAQATAAAVQPDGKLVVVGVLYQFRDHVEEPLPPGYARAAVYIPYDHAPGSGSTFALRFNPDGSLDPTFGDGGRQVVGSAEVELTNRPSAVAVAADGKLVVAGVGGRVLRLTADGQLDSTFGTGGRVVVTDWAGYGSGYYLDAATPPVPALLVRPDGRVLLATNFYQPLDPSVPPYQSLQYDLDVMLVQLAADGSRDTGFGDGGRLVLSFDQPGATDLSHEVFSGMAVDAAGRLVVAITSESQNPVNYRRGPSGEVLLPDAATVHVLRFDPAGVADPTFGSGGKTVLDFGAADRDAFGRALALDAAGRVLVAGSAQRGGEVVNGPPGEQYSFERPVYDLAVARLTADGLPDAGFGVVTVPFPGGNDRLAGFTVLADGRLLLAGTSRAENNPTDNGSVALARLTDSAEPPPAVPPIDTSDPIRQSGRPRVASDLDGDGTADVVVLNGPQVSVVSGADNRVLLPGFAPFEAGYTGTLNAVLADLDGDGRAELVVAPEMGGGPVVAVFRADGAELARFLGIEDANFRGGARVAAGDLDGDGASDLVVTAGEGGGPRVAVFDGRQVAVDRRRLVGDFYAFEEGQRGGATVAAGDVTGDGRVDLTFGAGAGGGPRVVVLDGVSLVAGGRPTVVADFFADDPAGRDGVAVGVRPGTVTTTTAGRLRTWPVKV